MSYKDNKPDDNIASETDNESCEKGNTDDSDVADTSRSENNNKAVSRLVQKKI